MKQFFLPPQLKSIWYTNNPKLESADSVHQILMFGTLKEIKSLKKQIGDKTVVKLFVDHPKKVYNAAALNFIKNFILGISTSIDEQKYLKYTSRPTR